MTPEQEKRLRAFAHYLPELHGLVPPRDPTLQALCQIMLEHAERIDMLTRRSATEEWPIGKSLPETVRINLDTVSRECRAALDRMTYENSIPKPPLLGGGSTPQDFLHFIAREEKKRGAHQRALEAEHIADWIDAVIALARSPKDEAQEEREQVNEAETSDDAAPPSADPHSRARLRDELAMIATRYPLAPTLEIECILDRLQEHHLTTYGYRSGWIERIRVGNL